MDNQNNDLRCKKSNHEQCNWRCNFKQSERVKKYYHDKAKNRRYDCENCGASVLISNKKIHTETEKCKLARLINRTEGSQDRRSDSNKSQQTETDEYKFARRPTNC